MTGNNSQGLIALLPNWPDYEIVKRHHWYRIPVQAQQKWLTDCWPPAWIAFYNKLRFDEALPHKVTYYAEVQGVTLASRRDLFPNEGPSPKSDRVYHRLDLGPLQQLRRPIPGRTRRHVVFIPTTWTHVEAATQLNDLFTGSPLEAKLWRALKGARIWAERQEFVHVDGYSYALDFAIYCKQGCIDVETDGDTWHSDPARIAADNDRNNRLTTAGWRVLRFNTAQITDQLAGCVGLIRRNVEALGGLA